MGNTPYCESFAARLHSDPMTQILLIHSAIYSFSTLIPSRNKMNRKLSLSKTTRFVSWDMTGYKIALALTKKDQHDAS